MKKFLLLLISCFVAQNAFAVDQGPVLPLKIMTLALDRSTHQYVANRPTPNSHLIADAFFNRMKNALKVKYPNYGEGVAERNKRENEEVTKQYFMSSATDASNFVFFVGHGTPSILYPYDTKSIDITKKRFRGNTYWVWLYSCSVFANAVDGDPEFNQMFDGAHSVLGFATSVTANEESISVPGEFADQWIGKGKKIWDAFKIAVQYKLHDAHATTMMPQGDGTSISITNVPAIAYRWGFVNGRATELSNEKFATAYKGPVLNSSTYNNDPSYFSVKKQVYTRPTY